MTFAEAVSTPTLYGALSGNGKLADYATPEALKARIMPEAVKETARRFLVSALKPMLKLYGMPETSATGLARNVTQRSRRSSRLSTCATRRLRAANGRSG